MSQVGDSMSRRQQPRTVLEHLLRERGLTQRAAVQEFERIAAESNVPATLSERHLSRLASGETQDVRSGTAKVLGLMFEQSAEGLLTPWSPELSVSPIADAAVTVHTSTQEELMNVTVRRARQFIRSGQYVTAEAIDQMRADVGQIASGYQQRPLTLILSDLVESQDALFAMIDHRHRPDDARQIHLLAGLVSGILAKGAHDMADPHSALTHARTAFLLADQADNDGLKAWIRGLQSFISYWANRPHDAINFAKEGQTFGNNSSRVWLAANEARAWSAVGDHDKVVAAIERGERAAEEVELDEIDAFGGICTFGRSRQLYYAADALASFQGASDQAANYAELALDAYSDRSADDWSFSDEAGSSADLALARVASGEMEGAAEALEPVLELDPSRRIHGIIGSVERVHRAISEHGTSSTAATELQQEIEVFTRAPLASLQSLRS